MPRSGETADENNRRGPARRLAAHSVIDGHNDRPWVVRTRASGLGDVAAYDLRERTPRP